MLLTVSFQLVRHLVYLALQPCVPGELIHHAYRRKLQPHVLDFCSHLHFLLGIFLQDLGQLHGETLKKKNLKIHGL